MREFGPDFQPQLRDKLLKAWSLVKEFFRRGPPRVFLFTSQRLGEYG